MRIIGRRKLDEFAKRHSTARQRLQHFDPVASVTYPEGTYQWLVEILDRLINFWERHGHFGTTNLTENEYEWLDDVLEELIYSVGENENHILAPLIEFVTRLISSYEDAYVPKLTEQSLKLAEKETLEDVSEDDLAAHAFFLIGYLLYQGKQAEKALAAYGMAIALKPNFWEAYNNRGGLLQELCKYDEAIADFGKAIGFAPNSAELYVNRGCAKGLSGQHKHAKDDFNYAIKLNPSYAKAYCCRGMTKIELNRPDDAKSDFQTALELAEQQKQENLIISIQKKIQELSNLTT